MAPVARPPSACSFALINSDYIHIHSVALQSRSLVNEVKQSASCATPGAPIPSGPSHGLGRTKPILPSPFKASVVSRFVLRTLP